MEIILASGNKHKQREIEQILAPHRVLIPADIGCDFAYEENGTTFFENAFGKARHLFDSVRAPVLADDSGLVVEALDGQPGVRSARYGETGGSPNMTDVDRYELLLKNMRNAQERCAFFVCCLVLYIGKHRFCVVEERFDGEITKAPVGSAGFGYDPVFFVKSEGKTVAEMSAFRKNEISHRGRALAGLRPVINAMNV